MLKRHGVEAALAFLSEMPQRDACSPSPMDSTSSESRNTFGEVGIASRRLGGEGGICPSAHLHSLALRWRAAPVQGCMQVQVSLRDAARPVLSEAEGNPRMGVLQDPTLAIQTLARLWPDSV